MKELALSINGTPISAPGNAPSGGIDIGQNLLQVAVTGVFLIVISLGLIFVIYSGIQWTMSGGDKQKLQQARARITFSIIGLVVALAAFFIVRVVMTLIGSNSGLFF